MSNRLNMISIAVLVCTAAWLCPAPVSAGGTHFLVEPYSGMVFNQGLDRENAVGLESGAVLAVGGKLKGFPPRFYLYFRASQTFFGKDEVPVVSHDTNGCVQRSYTAVLGGLRVIIPIWLDLRLNLEVGGGSFFSRNSYYETGFRREYDENMIVMEFGAGLNWRLFSWLSLGVMYDYSFVAEHENGDMIATILGEADNGANLGWSRLAATVGFHF